MLVLVEDGDEDVEVFEHLSEARRDGQGDVEIDAVAPLREGVVERQAGGGDRVAERFEQAAQDGFTTAAGQDGQVEGEGQVLVGKVLAVLGAAGHGRAEDLAQGDAEEAGGDIGAVVDIGLQAESVLGVFAHQADGVDVDEQGGRAQVVAGFRVEDVGVAEFERGGVQLAGVLVQQEAKVGRGFMGGGNGQQHEGISKEKALLIGSKGLGKR